MNVAIMFSGGKDSTLAIEHALEKGWSIKYLISIKPTRTDCYLFHYATVEHTKELAEILKIHRIMESCQIADAEKEADIVREIVKNKQKDMPINAVVLGGTGLQATQIKSIQDALMPLGIEVFACHAGEDHDLLIESMLNKGYEIMITQVASEGLMQWLGKRITKENFKELKRDSVRYKFHIGFEGGYADTLVLDAPIFNKKLKIDKFERIVEDDYSGYIKINRLSVLDKEEKVRQQ